MDDFLLAIGGLVDGYKPNSKRIISSDFFRIEKGWFPLIKKLITDLIEVGWNREICCIKEKFGGLRFYITEGSDEVWNLILNAEEESLNVCEKCGSPGKIRTDIGWLLTLCDKHYNKKREAI